MWMKPCKESSDWSYCCSSELYTYSSQLPSPDCSQHPTAKRTFWDLQLVFTHRVGSSLTLHLEKCKLKGVVSTRPAPPPLLAKVKSHLGWQWQVLSRLSWLIRVCVRDRSNESKSPRFLHLASSILIEVLQFHSVCRVAWLTKSSLQRSECSRRGRTESYFGRISSQH